MAAVNRQITLAARPIGFPAVSDFRLVYATVPVPAAGEVLVRSVYLSLDPYVRGRMAAAAPHACPMGLGEVMIGGAVGFVVASEDPRYRAGDVVEGMLGWQEFAVVSGRLLRRIDPDLAPISTALGVLGAPGLTAYFGLLEIGDPQPGDTVVVSVAAGAVGMLVGQIAKIRGSRVVGVAGADAKTSWLLDELGFDAAFTYEGAVEFEEKVRELCPDGVDVYFDNVGGTITDAVMQRLATGARIVLCGESSQYNLAAPESGPRWLGQLILKQAKAQGFLVASYAERYPEALAALAGWLREGKLQYREEVAQGIESAPQAFIGMLHGMNNGKQLVQLSGS